MTEKATPDHFELLNDMLSFAGGEITTEAEALAAHAQSVQMCQAHNHAVFQMAADIEMIRHALAAQNGPMAPVLARFNALAELICALSNVNAVVTQRDQDILSGFCQAFIWPQGE